MAASANRVELATELTLAWLSRANTRASAADVAAFFQSMHRAVSELDKNSPSSKLEVPPEHPSAVTERKSLASREHIISMIDGKPYKALKRHLSAQGLTPDQYRQRYNLKTDYPMVAAAYSEARSAMAKALSLGRKAGQKVEESAAPGVNAARKGIKGAFAAVKEALGVTE